MEGSGEGEGNDYQKIYEHTNSINLKLNPID